MLELRAFDRYQDKEKTYFYGEVNGIPHHLIRTASGEWEVILTMESGARDYERLILKTEELFNGMFYIDRYFIDQFFCVKYKMEMQLLINKIKKIMDSDSYGQSILL